MHALRSVFDPFVGALLGVIVSAALVPARGVAVDVLDTVTMIGIGMLFFLHGARLSREALVAGIVHWRLHLLVLIFTFALFPLLGLLLWPFASVALSPELAIGIVFLCALPSTVQSSIAFTAIARGNVPAAVCSASLSNVLGVVMTPLLVSLMLSTRGAIDAPLESIGRIMLQLLAPFVAGHLLRPLLGAVVERHARTLSLTDRGTVLLIVYVAFSASMVGGLWHGLSWMVLTTLFVLMLGLLVLVLGLSTWTSRRFGFDRTDEVAIVFCASKKSLASGVPIANILFAGNPALGLYVLPILLYHQLQLIACAMIAQHYARTAQTAAAIDADGLRQPP